MVDSMDYTMTSNSGTPALPAAGSLAINTIGMRLTALEQAQVDAFKGWFSRKQAEAVPFRLLDLLGEIRNRVYSFVMAADNVDGHDLAKFALAPITRTNQQLRNGSLPLFFSENSFHAVIRANYGYREKARIAGEQGNYIMSQPDSILRQCGILGIKQPVGKTIRAAGASALIRAITFKIIDTDDFSVPLNKGRVGVHFEVKDGNRYPGVSLWIFRRPAKAAVDDTTAAAKEAVLKIAARKGFKGFAHKDLEEIAKAFRFVY